MSARLAGPVRPLWRGRYDLTVPRVAEYTAEAPLGRTASAGGIAALATGYSTGHVGDVNGGLYT